LSRFFLVCGNLRNNENVLNNKHEKEKKMVNSLNISDFCQIYNLLKFFNKKKEVIESKKH